MNAEQKEILSKVPEVTLGFWIIIFLVLLPLAMTMALLWKTKEVILESVFNRKQ